MSTDLDHSGRLSWSARLTASFQPLLSQCSPRFPITTPNQSWNTCDGRGALGQSSSTYGRLCSSNSRSNNINNGERS